jgi:CDP-paratose synthetase
MGFERLTSGLRIKSKLKSRFFLAGNIVKKEKPKHPEVIWITGASGFLGQRLVNFLLEETEAYLVCISRDISSKRFSSRHVWATVMDLSSTNSIPRPELVIHAATDYGRGDSPKFNTLEANFLFPIRIIEIAGSKLESFIAVDTYYNKGISPYTYLPHYCTSKRLLIEWLKREYLDLQVTRVFVEHLYGPGDSKHKFVPKLLQDLSRNSDIDMTQGDQVRDFIYVDDAAKAIIEVLLLSYVKDTRYAEYEIGTGEGTSVKDFARIAKAILRSSSELKFGSLTMREGEIRASIARSPLDQGLAWRPKFSIEEGLREITSREVGTQKQ